MKQSERNKTTIMTMLFGVGIGLVLAPQSGKAARRQIREAGQQAKKRAVERIDLTRKNLEAKMRKVSGVTSKFNNFLGVDRHLKEPRDNMTKSPIVTAWY